MIRHLFIALFMSHLCIPAATAAAAAPRALAWDQEVAARKLALVAGASVIAITDMHPSKRTGRLHVKGDGPLIIRALDKPPGPDGKPVELACAIPEAMKFPLLVIMPDPAHPTGIRLLIVDDNPLGFRWGSYRFLNATAKEIVVQMEKKALRIPGGWKPIDLDLGGATRGVGVRVALAEAIEKPLYSAVWEYNTEVRTLCFIVPGTDPRLGPVAFKSIPESRRAVEPTGE